MFDANAAHIPIGNKFFAEVHSTDSQLAAIGLSEGDIILCSHISNLEGRPLFNHQTNIWVALDAEPVIYTYTRKRGDWSWLVYSGSPSGNGFISEKWKAKALAFLGGKWL